MPISPALAAALGVGEDADDDTALAAVEKLRTPAPPEPSAQTQEGGTSISEPAPAEVIQQAVAAAVAPFQEALKATSTELAELKADKVAAAKSRTLDDAVGQGRITPAMRAVYAKQYDRDPEGVSELLASLAVGSAVPLAASGRPGTEIDDALEREWAQVAPAFGVRAEG